jgi:hypothetical protein
MRTQLNQKCQRSIWAKHETNTEYAFNSYKSHRGIEAYNLQTLLNHAAHGRLAQWKHANKLNAFHSESQQSYL